MSSRVGANLSAQPWQATAERAAGFPGKPTYAFNRGLSRRDMLRMPQLDEEGAPVQAAGGLKRMGAIGQLDTKYIEKLRDYRCARRWAVAA